ncbi:MAG: hypothetical protein R2821_08230 [Flavobacteriaceae bacterium]
MNEDELLKMLDSEIASKGLYHNCINTIKNILIEESTYYDRIYKIQERIMKLQFELGELSE